MKEQYRESAKLSVSENV